MGLTISGIDKLIASLNQANNYVNKQEEIIEKLAVIGANEVDKHHRSVSITNEIIGGGSIQVRSDAKVGVEKVNNGLSIVATGENFVFFEFGAGVEHNNPRHWKNILKIPVPGSISDIGTYGYGMGSQPYWRYSYGGEYIQTSGNKAVQGFAHAINAIVANLDDVIEEVIK